MSEAVTLDIFRARLAAAVAGDGPVPVVAQMAFGTGGHAPDGTAKPVDAARTSLYAEALRKPVTSITRPQPTWIEVKAVLTESDLVGQTLSEAALVDSSGQLIAMKTFAPKVKEADERIEITISLKF